MIRIVIGVVPRGEFVLMERRAEGGPYPNMWALPGGKVHDGETDQQALERELYEELAVRVRVHEKVGSCSLHSPRGELDINYYRAEILSGQPRAITAAEIRYMRLPEIIEQLPCIPSTYILFREIQGCVS